MADRARLVKVGNGFKLKNDLRERRGYTRADGPPGVGTGHS
jgi:hypothetical protein